MTHVFAVSHDSSSAGAYGLTVTAPAGWDVLGVPAEVAIGPGEEATIFVTLAVPPDAAAGSYVLTLTASAAGDPADDASAGVATRVAALNEIELVPPSGESVSVGASASYSVLVTNRGNAQDVVSITAISSRGYSLAVDPATAELSPRESRSASVTLVIPQDAAPGRDVVTVRASSTLYAGVEDEVAIFTTILPPGPDDVRGSLFESLPTQVRIGIDRSETESTFDSRVSVSTAGDVLDGAFSAQATAIHPLGPGTLDVTSYLIGYRLDDASFLVGNVSQTLSDLQAISCDGGAATLDARFTDLALIAGGRDGETRFGGCLAFGPEEVNAGLTFSDVRTETARTSAWTGLAAVEPLDGWTLRAEGGYGVRSGKRGRAALFGTKVGTDAYTLSAAVFSVGTYFPGPRTDTAGIEASQRLRLSELSLGLSLSHVWNNVIRDPLAETLVADSFGANLTTTPWDEGPTLQATLTLDRRRQAGPAARDEVDALLAYGVTETEGSFPYAFSGRVADRLDFALGTHERTLTHTQEVGLSLDVFVVSLELREEKVVDVNLDLVLRSAASASVSVRPSGAPHEASIDFRWAGDDLALNASFLLHAADDLSVTLGGTADWDRSIPGSASFGWSLEIAAAFDVPLPFLVTKGRIEGRVFVDQDEDGQFDPEEAPAPGVIVFTEEGEASTAEDGRYRFSPLAPRPYSIGVRNLPPGTAFGDPILASLAAGEVRRIDIALLPVLHVRGVVFVDANQDAQQQSGERGLPDVRVVLAGDAETSATVTDPRGEFAFSGIRPGTYTVSLDAGTLPERFQFTTEESQPADPASDDRLSFGGFVRPRPVVVTFQPPTADATYNPVTPRAGEPVTFDASASFDFDGTIASTAWDFDSDGTVDSSDVVATHTFALAGEARVTLTVTDDAGNQDRAVIELVIAAAIPGEGEATPATPGAQDTPETPEQPVTPTTPPASGLARPPVAGFAYQPVAPRAGDAVAFDAASSVDFDGPIEVYAWDFDSDGAADAEGATAEHTFSTAGIYRVSLTVVDATGLQDAATYNVEVLAPGNVIAIAPAELMARFKYAPSIARREEAVRFDASESIRPGGASLAYSWDFDADGAGDSTEVAPEWAFVDEGTYPVTLTVTMSDGRSDTHTLAMTVLPPESNAATGQAPIATLQYVPTSPREGDPVMFNAAASVDLDGRIVAYAWDFEADGFTDSSEPIAVHAFARSGVFAVRLTVFDDAGLSGAVDATLVVP